MLRPAEIERAAAFRSALRRFLIRTKQAASDAGLTPQRYDLLLAIKAGPDETATITELGDQLSLKQAAVSELVRRAEEAGLVRRELSAEDARVNFMHLTPEGEERLEKAFVALRAERARLTRHFDELEDRFREATARGAARRGRR